MRCPMVAQRECARSGAFALAQRFAPVARDIAECECLLDNADGGVDLEGAGLDGQGARSPAPVPDGDRR